MKSDFDPDSDIQKQKNAFSYKRGQKVVYFLHAALSCAGDKFPLASHAQVPP
jgi:hypothetical protein